MASISTKIYIEKVRFIRPKENPKKGDLELNTNWKIDYKKMDDDSLEYICNLKVEGEFPATFVVEGIVECSMHQKDNKVSKEVSQSILDNAFQIMVNIINLTKGAHIGTTHTSHQIVKTYPKVAM
ncbi:pilus assembly protein [Methanothermococcus sp. Ax23]|uniref:pilus assembly protein n=1 Tax=Methanothermococcus sp. Ax23 TaxID=3156486 RepID=UPI003BA29FD1